MQAEHYTTIDIPVKIGSAKNGAKKRLKKSRINDVWFSLFVAYLSLCCFDVLLHR
jgi:hypothetical protein